MKVCILLKLVFTELLDVFMLKNIVEGNTLLRIKYEDQCEEAEGIGGANLIRRRGTSSEYAPGWG